MNKSNTFILVYSCRREDVNRFYRAGLATIPIRGAEGHLQAQALVHQQERRLAAAAFLVGLAKALHLGRYRGDRGDWGDKGEMHRTWRACALAPFECGGVSLC